MNLDLLAANLAAHWIQAGLIATAAILALAVLRVKDPRLRLVALQTTVWLIVLVPWAQPWHQIGATPAVSAPPPLPFEGTSVAAPPSSPPRAAASRIEPVPVALAIVGAGIVVRLSWLAYGGLCLVRFRRNGRAIPVPDVAGELQRRLKVAPRYIERSTPGGPSTFGFFGATIALPAGFRALDPKFQRAIICHELVHVRRRDTTMAFVEELLTAALWFHPWMWLIRSRIRVAREQVVDRVVLKLIGDRAEYVRCLIELSGHDLLPHLGTGMLSSRELRTRIDAMFQEGRMSHTRTIAISMVLVAVVGITSQAAARHAPLQAMTLAGIETLVPAPPGSPFPGLAVLLAPAPPGPAAVAWLQQPAAAGGRGRGAPSPTPAGARARTKMAYAEYPIEALEKGISGTVTVNIVVNAAGDVTSAGVISGPQELRASAFKAALGLKYAPGPSTTAMTISVNFLLDQQSWGVRIVDRAAPEDVALQDRLRQLAGQLQQTAGGAPPPPPPGVVRVGGAIRQPRKIKDVPPVYPAIARTARVQGVVIIEASIDPAGNVGDARILRSIPLLDQAAVDAVTQWQYEPTLLNGTAVPIIMTLTVNFTLADDVTLRITSANGATFALRMRSTGGVAVIDVPGTGQVEFATAEDPGSSSLRVSITELRDGVRHPLGSVDVALGTGVVQSATTPSFGVEAERIVR
jgi:TonB family protein